MRASYSNVLALLLICGLAISGCQDPTPKSVPAEPQEKKSLRIALIVKYLGNPFFDEVRRGAEQAGADLGIDVLVYAASGNKGAHQIQLLKRMKRENIDGIILMPVNSTKLVPSVLEIMMLGRPFVVIDTPLEPASFVENGFQAPPLITVDNYQAAYEVGRYVLERASRPAQVLILTGPRTSINIDQRYQGFVQAIASTEGAQLIAEANTEWTVQDGLQVVKEQVEQNPSINTVLAANDLLALGAAKAAEELGLPIAIAGYDNLAEARAAIGAGTIIATIDQSAFAQGYEGVVTTLKLIQNQRVEPLVLLPATVITRESINAAEPVF